MHGLQKQLAVATLGLVTAVGCASGPSWMRFGRKTDAGFSTLASNAPQLPSQSAINGNEPGLPAVSHGQRFPTGPATATAAAPAVDNSAVAQVSHNAELPEGAEPTRYDDIYAVPDSTNALPNSYNELAAGPPSYQNGRYQTGGAAASTSPAADNAGDRYDAAPADRYADNTMPSYGDYQPEAGNTGADAYADRYADNRTADLRNDPAYNARNIDRVTIPTGNGQDSGYDQPAADNYTPSTDYAGTKDNAITDISATSNQATPDYRPAQNPTPDYARGFNTAPPPNYESTSAAPAGNYDTTSTSAPPADDLDSASEYRPGSTSTFVLPTSHTTNEAPRTTPIATPPMNTAPRDTWNDSGVPPLPASSLPPSPAGSYESAAPSTGSSLPPSAGNNTGASYRDTAADTSERYDNTAGDSSYGDATNAPADRYERYESAERPDYSNVGDRYR